MRFHFGVSFRLRNLKKFLFPFLLGLLSYFGFSYFNLLSVYAYGNLDTYYDLEVEEQDFSSIPIGNYTMQDLLNFGLEETSDFYINTRYYKNSYSYGVSIDLFPKSYINREVSIYNNKASSSSSARTKTITSYDYSNSEFYSFYFGSTDNTTNLDNIYNALTDCLYMNSCSSDYSSNQYRLPGYDVGINIENDNSYSVDVFNDSNGEGGYYYINQLPVINRLGEVNNNWFFVKTIKVNNNIVEFGDNIPTYCDLYNCGSNNVVLNSVDRLDDFFISKIDKSDLTNVNISWTFKFYDLNYANSLQWQSFYFGRINHGNYYSYEPIDCITSWNGNESYIDEDTFIFHRQVYSISCSSDLNSYDYIYGRYRLSESNDKANTLISNLQLSSDYGFINVSPIYNGNNYYRIMDYFEQLPSDFNILVSTTNDQSQLTFKSYNDYVLMSTVDRNTSKISNFATSTELLFGTYNNTNAMVYNYSPSYSGTTDLFLFFQDNYIISIGDNNSFTYYDSNNEITSSNIINTYQIAFDSYDLTYYFNLVNTTLENFNSNLVDLHNFLDSLYNDIPIFYQSIIILFVILTLTYLLFKVVRTW